MAIPIAILSRATPTPAPIATPVPIATPNSLFLVRFFSNLNLTPSDKNLVLLVWITIKEAKCFTRNDHVTVHKSYDVCFIYFCGNIPEEITVVKRWSRV